MIFQGIRTGFAKKPCIFVIFQGGQSGPLSLPHLDPRIGDTYHSLFVVSVDIGPETGYNFPYTEVTGSRLSACRTTLVDGDQNSL